MTQEYNFDIAKLRETACKIGSALLEVVMPIYDALAKVIPEEFRGMSLDEFIARLQIEAKKQKRREAYLRRYARRRKVK